MNKRLIEDLRTGITKLIRWRDQDQDQANAAKREATLRAADLTPAERQFLTFALDEFTDEDEAALATLRRMADESQPAEAADRTELRDRIAEALAREDGYTWGPGQSSLSSGTIEPYLRTADKVLAALSADTGQAALIEDLRAEITKLIRWRDEDRANAAKREAELRADNKALRAAVKCLRGDRATVLREAADVAAGWNTGCPCCATCDCLVVELRRMAGETEQS